MAESEQTPTTSKKRKVVYANPNKLTQEELLAALLESSDEEKVNDEIESDSDVYMAQGDSESEEDDSDQDDTGNKYIS